MTAQPRPGARISHDAREAFKMEAAREHLYSDHVIADPDMRAEKARQEAIPCPKCGQVIHPTNWQAHQQQVHADEPDFPHLHEATKRLPLVVIRTDGGTQPRAEINADTVGEYAEAMAAGAAFPPIEVYYDGQSYWLADGFHRVHAARQTDMLDIAAIVYQGTQRDAILHSVGVNSTHGLRRTNDDKRRAVLRLLKDEEWVKWSDREIARRCNVGHPLVSRVRAEVTGTNSSERTYTTKHGTTATMQTGNIGKPARTTYGPAEDDYQDDVPSRQVEEPAQHQATVRAPSGQVGTLLSVSGRYAEVQTVNGVRKYDASKLTYLDGAPETATPPVNFNYKRDTRVSRPADDSESKPYDRMQTPPYALDPLLPYLGWSLPSTIWEPACGEGLIVEGLYDAGWTEEHVIGTDILTGQNFFEFQPDKWEVIVTNPPYSLKLEWLTRCYELGKPFALLVPGEFLFTGGVQDLVQAHGFEMMLLRPRVDFKMPNVGWNSHAQFATFWLCHDLLPKQVMFADIRAAKKAFIAELGLNDEPEADDDDNG